MFWRRKKTLTEDIKSVAEVAGDQVAPGMGTLLVILGGVAVAGATAYVVHQKKKANKKAAR